MEYLNKEEFLVIVNKMLNPVELELSLISKCWDYSRTAHKGQLRDSKEEYFIHPVRVSIILLKTTNCDVEMIAAALLHDVVEDTNITLEDIQREFGKQVSTLVDGLTKVPALDEIYEKNLAKEISKRNSVQKLFNAISSDMRVALIKLADRLHNLRTLGAKTDEKIERICKETLLIYVPLAEILGVSIIQKELQDLAFSLAYPSEYKFIKIKISQRDQKYMQHTEDITSILEDELDQCRVKARVYSRRKEPYSIFSKLKAMDLALEDIYDVYDIIGFRIIIEEESIADCYKALSIVNNLGKNFKYDDYIQMPRGPHQYKALHKVFTNKAWGKVEVQIRTVNMHYHAERGASPHWKYKMNVELSKYVEHRLRYLSNLIDQQDSESANFSQTISIIKDGLKPFKRVITPKKESVFLPENATILDFAYHIHSTIGDECMGAKVIESNGKMRNVKVDWVISHLSEVEIITKTGSKPSLSWITSEKAKTPRAQNRIKSYFNKENRKEAIEKGKEYFNKYSKLAEKSFGVTTKEISKSIGPDNQDSLDSLYHFVATKNEKFKIKLGELILKFILKKQGYGKDLSFELFEYFTKNKKINSPKNHYVYKLLGTSEIDLNELSDAIKNVKLNSRKILDQEDKTQDNSSISTKSSEYPILLSKCCNPIIGDKIIGLLSRNGYMKIHRENCINVIRLNEERLMPFNWIDLDSSIENTTFYVELEFEFINQKSHIRNNIKKIFENLNIEIDEVFRNRSNRRDSVVIYNYVVKLENINILEEALDTVQKLEEVISVIRTPL